MSKKILLVIVMILLVAIGGTIFYVFSENGEEETTTFVVPNVLQPYIKIQKNEELSSKDLKLNGSNKEMDYYFDIYNYDESTDEYSQLELIPYVKLDIQSNEQQENTQNLISVNLFYIKDITAEMTPENMEEIVIKGEAGSNFENYFECKKLNKYDENNQSQNISHYVAKIILNTEAQEYIDFTGTIEQKLDMVFGYKQYVEK